MLIACWLTGIGLCCLGVALSLCRMGKVADEQMRRELGKMSEGWRKGRR